jgi:2-polyprenyl-6-methoxyphenol hydroxylase-like FAD-dependent oxidoreductase
VSTPNSTVLISGASVAGTALAFWLNHHGFSVSVVERYQGLRPGGQAIDVRGPALTVLDRMGLLEAATAKKTAIRGMSLVDADGNEVSRHSEATATGGIIDNDDLELLRDDLVAMLYAAAPNTEYLFGDSVVTIDDHDGSVVVGFEQGPTRAFDLVIGADGLHSNVRRLAFGPESDFIKHMDMYAAIFTAPNFLGLDYWQLWHGDAAGRFFGLYSARENTESRVMFGFPDNQLSLDYRDVAAQRAEIVGRFAESGPFASRLLAAMRGSTDFYCDEMAQILMDTWSRGRVALVGDAAHCASPMSGQGTSLALIGAYVLAGELAAANGDHRLGFTNYEVTLRQHVLDTQALAFEDNSDEDVWAARFYPVINSFAVKDYPAAPTR